MNTKEQVKKVYGSTEFVDQDGNFKYEQSVLKAIRKKCLHDCCCGSYEEVKNCNCTTCFLYPFRLGTNPFRKKYTTSEEVIENRRKNMTELRSK